KDCMTPRVETFALADELTNEQAIAQLKEKRFRRVPVYADTPDNIVGIVDVKLFLLDPSEHYTERLLAPSFVPETMRALDLLKLFVTHPQSLAIVVDEFGGTEGIITMSDIVEEILSEAAPARGDVDLYIEPLENGKFLVSGHARLDDLREHLGFELEAEGIDAGLTSIDPVRLRSHVKLNRPAAVRLDRLLQKPERLLVTVLLVTNLADILALLLLTRLLVIKFGAAGFALSAIIALPIYLF